MIKFFHKLFNPHCPECKLELLESKVCDSCDTLRLQLARVSDENQRLLEALLNSGKPVEVIQNTDNLVPIMPHRVPLSVRREQYEREDRLRAAQMRERAPKPDKPIDVKKELETLNELKDELDNVRQERKEA